MEVGKEMKKYFFRIIACIFAFIIGAIWQRVDIELSHDFVVISGILRVVFIYLLLSLAWNKTKEL